LTAAETSIPSKEHIEAEQSASLEAKDTASEQGISEEDSLKITP